MFCVKCGSEVHGQFCTSCGTPLGGQTDETLSSAQTELRAGPPTAMTGGQAASTTVGAVPPPRRGPGAGALIAGLAAVALVAGAAVAVAVIMRGSDNSPAQAQPGGTVTVPVTPTPAGAKTAAPTTRAPRPVVTPGMKVAYWTSRQGTTRCVYYPQNKNGIPSVNCWHQGLGVVYHLYPGSVEGENLAYVSDARAQSLRAQFNAAPGTPWRFNQSETFVSPLTRAAQFRCTLDEIRGMVCTDLGSGHGFQLNKDTPGAW